MPGYFDYAATTPVKPSAAQAAYEVMKRSFGNPSAGYTPGREVSRAMETWRTDVARAVGCYPDELFFTSGGTEGDNWALFGAAEAMKRRGNHILTTAIEHAAVLESARRLERQGFRVTYLQPNREGRISEQAFADALQDDTVLVSMMLVNNELGTILPVVDCAKLARERCPDLIFHTDAVQALGHVAMSPEKLGVDLLTVSGHKIGAPKGVGALYIKKALQNRIRPSLFGGGQERGLRSGTEATAQIAAFAAACRECDLRDMEQVTAMKNYILEQLQLKVPGLVVISKGDAPHIFAISLPGYPSQMVMNDLDEKGLYVANGSACHKGKPSHVFASLGLPGPVTRGALRISLSPETRREEADELVQALVEITEQRLKVST